MRIDAGDVHDADPRAWPDRSATRASRPPWRPGMNGRACAGDQSMSHCRCAFPRHAIVRGISMKAIALLSAFALLGLVGATPAGAIPRTFVSSTGVGSACTRVAPCTTFQAAHDATDLGGEINCLGSGSFGGLSITKSITIDCAGTVAA